MSQPTPRKHQNASYSPHSHHAPRHPQHQQQQQQQHYQQNPQAQYAHSRSRSQQLRAQAAVEQQHLAAAAAAVHTASDYESDTAHYMAAHPGPTQAALAARTNTELNLGVLRRYRPDVSSILSIAANAVVYVFNTASSKWDKANLEGTLFICAQRQDGSDYPAEHTDTNYDSDDGTGDGLLFILNRKNLTNLTLDLRAVADYELATDLLIFRLEEENVVVPMENREPVRPKVLGLWIHAESDQDRSTSSALIYELWTKARAGGGRDQETEQDETTQDEATSTSQSSASPAEGASAAAAPHEGGRPVTLNELFGRGQNGFGVA
ncbi:PH domain-like protein [Hypoxylon sp. FL1150]|nr:PH domain-like protein [Hypoxylon sp. FL1150]